MLAIFPERANEPSIFGIQVGRIYFGARCLFRACRKPAAICIRPIDRIGRPAHRDLLVCEAHSEQLMVRERERKAGRARKIERPLLFNTWIGLVHHYLVNRDVFATGNSVIAEQGDTLVNHFMTLIKP